MPLPLIIGAGALATAAFGAKKGYDGYKKHSEADEIVKSAKSRYERKKTVFSDQEKETIHALDVLGKKELEIGQSLGEFKILADSLLKKLNSSRDSKLEINLPKHELQRIEDYSYTVAGVLGTVAGAGTAGAAAGFAVYGGVMTLGAASTGTPIAALSGIAAKNAALAAIGGGSLKAGGLGMAGGSAILGAAVAGPIVAIAGWAYDSHGNEALKNANKIDDEVDQAILKMGRAVAQLEATEEYARKIKYSLLPIYDQFNQYYDSLKGIDDFLQDVKGRNVDIDAKLAEFNDEIFRLIENGFALATILVDIITTPIFRLKKEGGAIVENEDGVPVMETDEDGFKVLNDTELDVALSDASDKAGSVEAA